MGNPERAGGRMFGAGFLLFVLTLGAWLAGCASSPVIRDGAAADSADAAAADARPCPEPPAPLGDAADAAAAASFADALQAGADALCRQAIDLIGNPEITDTNALNRTLFDLFRWAHQLAPDNTNVLEAAMFHLVDKSLFDEAFAIAQLYLLRHPGDHGIRYAAACCADAAGKPGVAAEQCAYLAALLPDDRALEDALIRLYFLSGQRDLAFAAMRAAFERRPDTPSKALPMKWAVFFSSQKKDLDLALQCISLALEFWTQPGERSSIWTLAGECHTEQGRFPEALDSFAKAFEEDDANMLAIQRLGMLAAEHPDAADRINAALDGFKQPGVARLLMQASAALAGQPPDKVAAIDLLREAYARSLRNGYFPGEGFYLWLVMLLDAERRGGEAIALLQEAAAVHPDSPEVKNCLAYLWAERGENLPEANALINDALQHAPLNPAYLDTKGWILFKLNRPHDALQYLLKASELQPDEPVILDHTGDALSAIGRTAEAAEFWKKSNKVSPNPDVEKKFAH